MPNRIIKETIRTSKSVSSLSDFDFRLWVYLITYVDDYGRGSADPELLKGMVFTRRKCVTEEMIQEGINRLAEAGMIQLYDVDDEQYMFFPNWSDHQRVRNSVEKFPSPDRGTLRQPSADCGELRQVAASCGELRQVAADCGESRPESNPIQSNPESNPESRIQNPESKRARDAKTKLEMFNRFWEIYPRKTAKQDAVKAWSKLKVDEDLLSTILAAVERQRASPQWKRNDGQFIPHPATWLNGHRWEDEVAMDASDRLIHDIMEGKYSEP